MSFFFIVRPRFGPLIRVAVETCGNLVPSCGLMPWLYHSRAVECIVLGFLLSNYLIWLCTAFIEEDTQHVPSTSIPHQHDQTWFLLPRRQAWGSYDNKRRKNVTCINTVKGWTHDTHLIIVFTSLYHPMIQSFRNKNGFQEGGQTMMRCEPWPATPKASKRFIPV